MASPPQPPMMVGAPRPTSAASAGSQFIILLGATSLIVALILSWAQLSQANPLSPLVQSKLSQQQQLEAVPAAEPASDATPPEHDNPSQPQPQQRLASSGKQATRHQNNVEKLKRGLTNFINQVSAAPFFVPQQQLANGNGNLAFGSLSVGETSSNTIGESAKSKASKTGGGGSQPAAEPAVLVNGDLSADALIKGPNRLAQTRPIGGPLRWGRR